MILVFAFFDVFFIFFVGIFVFRHGCVGGCGLLLHRRTHLGDVAEVDRAGHEEHLLVDVVGHRLELDKLELVELLAQLLLEQQHLDVLALDDHLGEVARALELIEQRLELVALLDEIARRRAVEARQVVEQRLLFLAYRLDEVERYLMDLALRRLHVRLALAHQLEAVPDGAHLDVTAQQLLLDHVLVATDALAEVDQVVLAMLARVRACQTHAHFTCFT